MSRVKELYWDEICSQPTSPFEGNYPSSDEEYEQWANEQDLSLAELYDNYEPSPDDLRF